MADTQRNLLTPKEAAPMIGRSLEWLRKKRKPRTDGPPWYRIGDRIMYRASDIEAWIESCKNAPPRKRKKSHVQS